MPSGIAIDPGFLRKLGLKDGQRLGLVGAPDAWREAFTFVPNVVARPSPKRAPKADVFVVWLTPREDPRETFDALESRIPPDGAIWAVLPKKSALAKGEEALPWVEMQAAGLASGRLVDNKELRFDDRYYGTRFVVRKERRPRA